MSNRSMLEDFECQTSRLHDRATKLLDGWDGMEDSNKKGERNENSLLSRSDLRCWMIATTEPESRLRV